MKIDWNEVHLKGKYFWQPPQDLLKELFCGDKRTILDIGCGTGKLSCQLAKMGHVVTGIDIAAVAIKIAKTACRDAFFYKADIECDDIRGMWDDCIFQLSLAFMKDRRTVLEACKKICTKRCIVMTPIFSHSISERIHRIGVSQIEMISLGKSIFGNINEVYSENLVNYKRSVFLMKML